MSILTLFSEFSKVLTKPTYENLSVLFRGAILSSGPRTVTECLRSAWPWVNKHFSSYENVLRRSQIREWAMAKILFDLALRLLSEESVIELIVDETLVRRYGPYVSGVSLHRDKVRSTNSYCRLTPGNMWVVLAIAVKLPFTNNVLALPILSALYVSPNPGKCERPGFKKRKHRTPSELAKLMLFMVSRWASTRRFRVIGDAWYATHELAGLLNEKSKKCPNGTMVSRFQWEARLHEDPGEYSGFGRPKIIGERLPNPLKVASAKNAKWLLSTVDWYGGKQKKVLLLSDEGLWYRCSQGATWVRWVIVRFPQSKRKDVLFFTTDKTLSPADIVGCYVRRWSIEVTFEETRRHLGIETLRNRNNQAVHRSVPMLFAIYSIIVTWFILYEKENNKYTNQAPWYEKKSVTFSDMLKTACQDILTDLVFIQTDKFTAEFQVAPFPMNLIYSLMAEKHKAP